MHFDCDPWGYLPYVHIQQLPRLMLALLKTHFKVVRFGVTILGRMSIKNKKEETFQPEKGVCEAMNIQLFFLLLH